MKHSFSLLLCILLLPSIHLQAVNYYLSSSGNNQASGNSSATAWRSIERLNSENLNAGDTVFFEGGKSFTGNIYLDSSDAGSPFHPLVLTSYGQGRAVILAGDSYGLFVYNAAGIEISNLEFLGSGALLNKKEGIHFFTDLKKGEKLEHIRVEQVDIHGFGKSGFSLGSWDSTYPGFKDVELMKIKSYSNETGLNTYDQADWKSTKYAHQDIRIRDCEFLSNLSSGIVLCGIDTGIIEYCRASGTGASGTGVVAIWAWSCKNLLFQYCIADGTVTSGPDGGGYDLDGGTENCIIQYCYSYNNAGPGYMHCDYPYSRPTKNNVIRYCLSENDGRKPADNRCSYLFISWGDGLEDCHMYNNTGYIADNAEYLVSGFWAYIMFGTSENPHLTGCTARNNLFYVKGDHHFLAKIEGGKTPLNPENILMQANCYFAEGRGSTRWYNNQSIYYDLNTWQDASGQELLLTDRLGINQNPEFTNPGGAGLITDPHKLPMMQSYRLESGSPVIDKGLDLKKLFEVETGDHDFFGNPSISGNSQDPGFHEFVIPSDIERKHHPADLLKIIPNPVLGGKEFQISTSLPLLSYSIYSCTGSLQERREFLPATTTEANIRLCFPGIYLLETRSVNGICNTGKVVVE
jgi:hypothetical protein